MKTMRTIYFTGVLFLVFAVMACTKKETACDNIAITDGWITAPQWLVHVVDSTAHSYKPSPTTGTYWYPLVYSVTYNRREYILVADALNSALVPGHMFFTCGGNRIDSKQGGDGLYWELFEKWERDGRRTSIWRQPIL